MVITSRVKVGVILFVCMMFLSACDALGTASEPPTEVPTPQTDHHVVCPAAHTTPNRNPLEQIAHDGEQQRELPFRTFDGEHDPEPRWRTAGGCGWLGFGKQPNS